MASPEIVARGVRPISGRPLLNRSAAVVGAAIPRRFPVPLDPTYPVDLAYMIEDSV
jgi:hypothetical protein